MPNGLCHELANVASFLLRTPRESLCGVGVGRGIAESALERLQNQSAFFSCASKNPQKWGIGKQNEEEEKLTPPSLVCAIIAPAHFPVLNPQHPEAQSASLKHWPVMNCEALALPTLAEPGIEVSIVLEPELAAAVDLAVAGAAEAAEVGWAAPPPTAPVKPNAFAALALGWALPKPHWGDC